MIEKTEPILKQMDMNKPVEYDEENKEGDKYEKKDENTPEDKKGATVRFPPPLIFIFTMAVAYGIHQLWPLSISKHPVLHYTGLILILLGITLMMMTGYLFFRAKTHIEPWKPTTTVITTGVFAWSRNPIYLAFCIATVGIGLYLNSLWITGSVIIAAILVYHIAIKKEEAYLAEKFGAKYLEYKNRVRRWL